MKLPVGFLPDEDQGTMFGLVQLPPGATNARTEEVIRQVEHHFLVDQKDAVSGIFTVAGFSFAGSGQNTGFAFIKLKPWDEREGEALSVTGVARQGRRLLRHHSRRKGVRLRAARRGGARQRNRAST